jgi:hypothetical protein
MHSTSPPEARAWLKRNKNPHAFAGNRFCRTDDALAFVESLYAAGAVEVLVDHIHPDRNESEGGPYADTFIVRVPDDWTARLNVERFSEEEGPGRTPPGDFRMDVRSRDIELWWD